LQTLGTIKLDGDKDLILKTLGTIKLDGTIDNSLYTVSDINKKNSITALSSQYSILFDNLSPVAYKYNNGTSGRLHTGFIA
jgi:hypothetical protein